jgi:hypothetical protein
MSLYLKISFATNLSSLILYFFIFEMILLDILYIKDS